MTPNVLDKIDAIFAKAERIVKLLFWLGCMVVSGVLWGARLEWMSADHEKRLSKMEDWKDSTQDDVTRLKARVPGFASIPPPNAEDARP